MSFALFADSSANLPGVLLRKYNIQLITMNYFIDGQPYSYCGDIEEFDAHTYYDMLRSGKKVDTSLINAGTFKAAFAPVLAQGQDLVYVGMSSGISGTVQSARIAAEDLMEEFPQARIRIVDSMAAGLGTGLIICRAAEYGLQGLSADQTADRLDQDKMNLCEYFTVGSLSYLHRTGRVDAATAALGSILNIKPLLRGDEEGHIVGCAKCRGRKKSIEAIVARYAEKVRDPENQLVFISHGDCYEDAQWLANMVQQAAKPRELMILPHEPATGSHVGPGMLALFFFGQGR